MDAPLHAGVKIQDDGLALPQGRAEGLPPLRKIVVLGLAAITCSIKYFGRAQR